MSPQSDVSINVPRGSTPAMDVDTVMWQVRAEMAKRRAAAGIVTEINRDRATGMAWRPAAPRLPDKDQFLLSDFLRFDDADFVDVVYRALLKRPANDTGSREYLEALRSGIASKIGIIGDIRFSDEGRKHAVHVDGLLRSYKLYRWRHIRVVGWFLGMGMALLGLPRLARRLQGMEASAARESQALGRWVNHLDATMATRLAQLESDLYVLQDEVAQARVGLYTASVTIDSVDVKTGSLEAKVDSLAAKAGSLEADARLLAARAESTTAKHAAELAKLNDRVRSDQRSLRAMLERLTVFLDVTVRSQRAIGGGASATVETPPLKRQYASFEQAFRGERGQIKQRVAHYLGTLEAAGITAGDEGVILDLGSGRGEWLEVLAERGYHALGIDLNRGMLNESESHGLEVVEADALDYLRARGSDTAAVISSMHLVEHIPHPVLIELLDEALRVLRPGGLLILETPNPENVLVGSCMFYMDPTHLRPIPPLLLQWTVQARGFQQVTIERLSEHRGEPALTPVSLDVPGAAQINQMVAWFTASPDYAVIARKPVPSKRH